MKVVFAPDWELERQILDYKYHKYQADTGYVNSKKEVCDNLRSTISNSSLVFPDIGIGEDRSLKVVVQHGCHEYDDSDGGDDGDDGDDGDGGDDGDDGDGDGDGDGRWW